MRYFSVRLLFVFEPQKFRYDIRPHARFETEFVFYLKNDESSQIMGFLKKVTQRERREYRLSIEPQSKEDWTLFWKISPSTSSRALLAHPEPQEWVATVSLTEEAFESLFEFLDRGQSFDLSDACPLEKLSNFHLRFEFRDDGP